MSSIITRRGMTTGLLATATMGIVGSVSTPARADDVLDARHVMEEAAITVERVRQEMKPSPDMDNLLQRSKGVLVIPSFFKAGFILGAAYGDGVLAARLPDGGFSDPVFYRMTAGSIGLQIGMQSAAIVFMILTEKGLSAVLNDEFKMGANVGMTIGTLGVGAEAATTTNVGKDIVAYSKNSGLFAGGALEGAVIRPREDWNAAVYGVNNDNPAAIVQRNQLRAATNLKDVLAKSVYPAEAPPAPAAAPIAVTPVPPAN
jgi:lipid-binding SYLF domain-containing protein